ncbi:MAG: hypothetical protein AB1656_02440 [Candidatus Omnitrophota bacterium]
MANEMLCLPPQAFDFIAVFRGPDGANDSVSPLFFADDLDADRAAAIFDLTGEHASI